MRHYGYPETIIRVLESVYKGTFSAVRVDGELTEWFETCSFIGVCKICAKFACLGMVGRPTALTGHLPSRVQLVGVIIY